MKKHNTWVFISVFPNLSFSTAFETKYAAIVPPNDARVKLLRKTYKSLDELLESFIDERLKKIEPSVLLIHKKAYSTKSETHSAIIAFRNIIALSVILEGWIPLIHSKTPSVFTTLYSDYYDLFPLDGYGDKLYSVTSPALNSIISNAKINYQSNYSLPNTNHFNISVDNKLFDALIYLWEDYFIKKNRSHNNSSLFRSLQLAFSACKMPMDNFSTFYDYGTKIGLWISSFEILFHPGGEGEIHFKDIIRELNKYEFFSQKNKTQYLINKKIQTNIVGLVYKEIYDARNNFFHGNSIDKNELYIFKQKKFPVISHMAPIIYLIALHVFLNKQNILTDIEPKNIEERIIKYIMQNRIEDIFIKIARKKFPDDIVTKTL